MTSASEKVIVNGSIIEPLNFESSKRIESYYHIYDYSNLRSCKKCDSIRSAAKYDGLKECHKIINVTLILRRRKNIYLLFIIFYDSLSESQKLN